MMEFMCGNLLGILRNQYRRIRPDQRSDKCNTITLRVSHYSFYQRESFSCLVIAMSKSDLVKSRPTRYEAFPPLLCFFGLFFFLFLPAIFTL